MYNDNQNNSSIVYHNWCSPDKDDVAGEVSSPISYCLCLGPEYETLVMGGMWSESIHDVNLGLYWYLLNILIDNNIPVLDISTGDAECSSVKNQEEYRSWQKVVITEHNGTGLCVTRLIISQTCLQNI